MSKATELLEQATPLPWTEIPVEADYTECSWKDADETLIVYAVNRLPDYEAAVEALERCINVLVRGEAAVIQAVIQARAALVRLHDGVIE